MSDFERELGDELRRRAESFAPSPDLPARIRGRVRSRQRRRQAVVGGIAAAVLAALVAVPLVRRDGGGEQSTAARAPATTASAAAVAAPAAGGEGDAEAGNEAADAAAPAGPNPAAASGASADEATAGGRAATTAGGGAATTAGGGAARSTTTAAAATTAAAGGAATTLAGGGPAVPPAGSAPAATGADVVAVLGDGTLAVVSATTGAVVRPLGATAGPGPVAVDTGGTLLLRLTAAPGCGAGVEAVSLADASVTPRPEMTDVVTVAQGGPVQAWIRRTGCAPAGIGIELVVVDANGATRRRALAGTTDLTSLAVSPDGARVAWVDGGGLQVAPTGDLTAATTVAGPAGTAAGAGCRWAHPAFAAPDMLAVARHCPGSAAVLRMGLDSVALAPAVALAGLTRVDALVADASGARLAVTGTTAEGTTAVAIVDADGTVRPLLTGATAVGWTTTGG